VVAHSLYVLYSVHIQPWPACAAQVPLDGTATPRWCDRPPFTLQCLYEPWTHCAPPPSSADHYARDAVKSIKLTRIHQLKQMWSGVPSLAYGAAYRFLFGRPRSWVRQIAICFLHAASLVCALPRLTQSALRPAAFRVAAGSHNDCTLHCVCVHSSLCGVCAVRVVQQVPSHFVSVHIRDSPQKRAATAHTVHPFPHTLHQRTLLTDGAAHLHHTQRTRHFESPTAREQRVGVPSSVRRMRDSSSRGGRSTPSLIWHRRPWLRPPKRCARPEHSQSVHVLPL
jgi:hypothetical protein